MHRIPLAIGALFLGCSAALSQVDKNKPTGRACLAIMNTVNGDEEALRPASVAGRNQKIVAHLEATAKAEALVAPYAKTGQLVPGWRPQFVDLRPGAEVLLPKPPTTWNWEKETGPIEVYVLFLAPESKLSAEIRGLVKAMSNADANVLKLQGIKLRELIGRMNFDRSAAQNAPKAESEVGGVMRMVVGFDWRSSARVVNFSPERPGPLIFPSLQAR